MYYKFVKTVNVIDTKIPSTILLVYKTQYISHKYDLEKKNTEIEFKIRRIIGLVTSTAFNIKVEDIETKIPNTAYLVTKAAL